MLEIHPCQSITERRTSRRIDPVKPEDMSHRAKGPSRNLSLAGIALPVSAGQCENPIDRRARSQLRSDSEEQRLFLRFGNGFVSSCLLGSIRVSSRSEGLSGRGIVCKQSGMTRRTHGFYGKEPRIAAREKVKTTRCFQGWY